MDRRARDTSFGAASRGHMWAQDTLWLTALQVCPAWFLKARGESIHLRSGKAPSLTILFTIGKELRMSDVMSKALLCGLGLASLTKDAIQKTAEDLVKQSKISEEEGRKVAKDLQRRSKQAQTVLEKEVDSAVHNVFQHLDLAAIINNRLKDVKPA